MAAYDVETVTVDGRTTALGTAGTFTLVVDRPAEAGGGGLGFSGGQLLNLAVAACISNDLFREGSRAGITLRRVRVAASSDYVGDPAVSTPIRYRVELEGDASEADLRALVERVDAIAEIPNSLRRGTQVLLARAGVEPIRRAVTVRCPLERAFTIFTAGMGRWWPVESYSRAVSELAGEGVTVSELEFQARPGGSILEHLSDGRVLPWAEVIAWRPPNEVVMSWRPHSEPEPPTEVAVTFTAREDSSTVVELEHRGWERLSEAFRDELYDVYRRGWPGTLGLFAAAAERP